MSKYRNLSSDWGKRSPNPMLKTLHTTSFWNIIIHRIFHDDLTEKLVSLFSKAKFVKWQKCKTALCDLTEKLLVSNFIGWPNLQIILEAKSMDESSWKKILLYQFLLYFVQFKSFLPWMAYYNSNINDLDFVTKDKSKLVKIVANWGHSRWKQPNLQKIELRLR